MLKNHCELELKAFLVWEEHVKMDPIEKLFNWYNIDLKSETKNDSTNKLGAEETTRIIGAAFRACQTQASPGSNTVGQFYCSQEELFKRIRRALDRASCIQDTSTTSGYNLHEKYFRPSYAAKYWLNRYFFLTVRMHVEDVERNKGRSSELSSEYVLSRLQGKKAIPLPNWVKLPKKNVVKRLAVIHVRRTPPSDEKVGRIMDETNLQHVARTIANVNCAVEARQKNPQQWRTGYTCLEPFSHVLLYGDFNYDKAESMRSDMEKELEKCKTKIKVGFVSRPWRNNKEAEMNKRLKPFWEKFNDLKFDCLPIQIKSLAIWVALCERYSPDICVIRHRSGFVEAAAFIGIPVFYLNNEREEMRGPPDQPGELLWMPPTGTAAGDRLREISDVMNTLIPIEALAREQEEDDTTGKKKSLRVVPRYEHELAAALFMYMCCVPTGTTSGQPAWMNRVETMHRAPGTESTSPGRTWLRDIYDNVHGDFRSYPR